MSVLSGASRIQCAHCRLSQQIRHASLLRRPKKPYTFTQLITLSDGSTFTHRTTSPAPIYRSTKDTKNSPLWNPSSQKLLNVEEDEAGRLKRFRARFGRGFDAEAMAEGEEVREGEEVLNQSQSEDSLLDLISGFGQEVEKTGTAAGKKEETVKTGKGKGGQK
ncbi:hypothetical protein DOTSEDRAFT_74921 [Dothistroma septosporum NZE10]|uniref:Ribosomal protein bL31m N-terminal domain-containing protein n=1 Tax=Dothistroma septosporum (strain NZE10 / CBS 128990) TaxID=675120 RepID=N1PCM3_DOTSN|nr:hypothetical protein DOTSEDRAFT_74921 [Dothistroma septosporum NZE10]